MSTGEDFVSVNAPEIEPVLAMSTVPVEVSPGLSSVAVRMAAPDFELLCVIVPDENVWTGWPMTS